MLFDGHWFLELSLAFRTGNDLIYYFIFLFCAGEVTDLAAKVAIESRRKTISPRCIMLAVHVDDELLKVRVDIRLIFPKFPINLYISWLVGALEGDISV